MCVCVCVCVRLLACTHLVASGMQSEWTVHPSGARPEAGRERRPPLGQGEQQATQAQHEGSRYEHMLLLSEPRYRLSKIWTSRKPHHHHQNQLSHAAVNQACDESAQTTMRWLHRDFCGIHLVARVGTRVLRGAPRVVCVFLCVIIWEGWPRRGSVPLACVYH